MPATIFSSASEVKSYGSNLSLNDVTKILSVSGNPASGAGTAAPVGSIALDYSNGKTYKKTGSLATEWAELGSGVGGINYIVNPDAESGTTGWSTYADAAGAQPVDGTGGSPSVTWTRSTTTPLRGTGDFNFVKDAANRQGQGVSYDVTVDSADLARVLTVSFDYEVVSGTYATGDLTVYLIQDPTGTPVVIQPAGYQVVSATAGTKMTQIATFQTDVAQKSYRLCFHVATTSASAYTLALDNIVLGPTQKVYGAPVTDWVSYTPTIGSTTGSVTNATATARYRRVGDSIEGEATITFSGASAAFANPNITLPAGLFGDTSKIPDTDTDRGIGICSCVDAGVTAYGPWYVGYNSITNKILAAYAPFANATSASTLEPVKGTGITNAYPFTFGNGDKIFISWKLPILGWSSNVEVSSSTDTRVVALRAVNGGSSTTAFAAGSSNYQTIANLTTVTTDTHGAFNSSTSVYTVPVPGLYRCTLGIYTNATAMSISLGVKQNSNYNEVAGFNNVTLASSTNGSIILNCKAGDTLTPQSAHSNAGSQSYGAFSPTYFVVERLSGPSQIAASETVAAFATKITGSHTSNGNWQDVASWTIRDSTHGALDATTGVFTAPISGRYFVSTIISFLANATGTRWARILKGLVDTGIGSNMVGTTSTTVNPIVVSGYIQLNAGETCRITAYQNSGGSLNYSTSTEVSSILAIVRVGN